MFGVDSVELLVVAVIALLVIGPKDLPKAMRVVGHWVGRARGMARHFRSGLDTMMREAELEEMEKKWREENERIMREFPNAGTWDPVDPEQRPPAIGAEAAAALPAPSGTASGAPPDTGSPHVPPDPAPSAAPEASPPASPPDEDRRELP